jgi:hypothetical protein
MIFGMIRTCLTALLLTLTMVAQDAQGPKVRIFFTEHHYEKASMTYALHQQNRDYYRHVFGTSMPSGSSFFEIQAATDRFKALVWAPGCKMKEFDVPVESSDIELQFACDPLKTVTYRGRLKRGEQSGRETITANYMAFGTCVWMDAHTKPSFVHCGGPQIVDIATADVATDGSFKIDLPDFSADPIVSGDSTAEIEFRLNHSTLLRPESSNSPQFGISATYPIETTFVPVEWETVPLRSH